MYTEDQRQTTNLMNWIHGKTNTVKLLDSRINFTEQLQVAVKDNSLETNGSDLVLDTTVRD